MSARLAAGIALACLGWASPASAGGWTVALTLDADGVLYAQSNARTPSVAFGLEARR